MSTPRLPTAGELDAFDALQRETRTLLDEVFDALEAGMTEREVAAAARALAARRGLVRWFHPPEVRFGMRIARSRRPGPGPRLRPGMHVLVDLAPARGSACADLAATVRFQAEDDDAIRVAREGLRATLGFCSRWKTVGELQVYARAWAVNHRMRLANARAIGHAILLPEGPLRWGWPRSAHLVAALRRHQIRFLNPHRVRGLWALRPVFAREGAAAAFEEVVYVDDHHKRILGAADLAEAARPPTPPGPAGGAPPPAPRG